MRAALLLALAASTAFADVSAPAGGGEARRRHVLTAAEARDCVPSSLPAEYFTPAASDVDRIEKALPAWLGIVGGKQSAAIKRVRERLGTDHRWYFGAVDKGRRVIEIRGFCAEFATAGQRCYPMVKDGGDCVWYLRFDVARGTFDNFGTNGYA
jgi:hypothetical protein